MFGRCTQLLSVFVVIIAVALYAASHSRIARSIPAGNWGRPVGYTHEMQERGSLMGKTVVVTGASAGLGKEIARACYEQAANVYMICRSLERCRAAQFLIEKESAQAQGFGQRLTGQISIGVADLANLNATRALGKELAQSIGYINHLFLNAGVMATPFMLSDDGIEMQFATNHVGHWLLAEELKHNIVKGGSVVVTSSGAHLRTHDKGVDLTLEAINDNTTYAPFRNYAQSKFANMLHVKELSRRWKDRDIIVNGVHPGLVRTELARYIEANVHPLLFKIIYKYLLVDDVVIYTARTAVQTILHAALDPSVVDNRVTGQYFVPLGQLDDPHPLVNDEQLAKKLWDFTAALVELKSPTVVAKDDAPASTLEADGTVTINPNSR